MNQLEDLVKKVKQLPAKNRPLLIAISGYGGSGKSTLADKLKQELSSSEVVPMDDFIVNRCDKRSDDWSSFDRERLRQQVLVPALANQPIRYQKYDWISNKLADWRTVPKAQYLIIEGCSLLHPNLAQYYDFSAWVDCPLEVATSRGIQRDRGWGNDHDSLWLNVWMPNERGFFTKYRPDRLADFIYETE